MKKALSGLLAGLLLTAAVHDQVCAQQGPSGFKLFLSRYELGYTLPKSWGDYTRTDRFSADGKTIDTSITLNVKSKASFGMYAGWFFPVKDLGRVSKLCIDAGMQYNLYTFDYPTATLKSVGDSLYYDRSLGFSGVTVHMGLPIGLSTRFGHDAMADKGIRWAWNAGVGVIPSMNLSADFDNADYSMGVQPYVKTEVGVFGGISWKLRLMYSFTNLTFMDVEAKNSLFSDGMTGTKLISHGNLNVSLIVMPFSFLWSKSGWYNTYGGTRYKREPRSHRLHSGRSLFR
jgi:hypothetical protein